MRQYWREVLIGLLVVGLVSTSLGWLSVWSRCNDIDRKLAYSNQTVLELSGNLRECWAQKMPVEFDNYRTFEAWLWSKGLSGLEPGTLDCALRIHKEALKDGYLVSYVLVRNKNSGQIEFWSATEINDTIYFIDHRSFKAQRYYPRVWIGD